MKHLLKFLLFKAQKSFKSKVQLNEKSFCAQTKRASKNAFKFFYLFLIRNLKLTWCYFMYLNCSLIHKDIEVKEQIT